MNVILSIGGKEAIPVRALAFVSNWAWSAEPHSIALACATPPTTEVGSCSISNRHALPAYLLSGSAYRQMSSDEWEPFIVDEMECLEKTLKADERVENEKHATWRKQAVPILPDGAFVWLDDFQRWFSATRPLKTIASPSNDEDLNEYYEQESDALNLDPYIPTELRQAIFSGFERYRNNDETITQAEKKPALREQEQVILTKIEELGYDSKALPKPPPGKSGVRAEVRKALSDSSLFNGVTTFDKAWQRLRDFGEIAESA